MDVTPPPPSPSEETSFMDGPLQKSRRYKKSNPKYSAPNWWMVLIDVPYKLHYGQIFQKIVQKLGHIFIF